MAFNPAERKITLSIKALQPRPEAEPRPERKEHERHDEDRPRVRKSVRRGAASEGGEEDEYREWSESASFGASISELIGSDEENK